MYRLLIADDNLTRAQQTQSLLDWSVYGITSVIAAGSYQEAEQLALEQQPHLALVSLHLGPYMGYDLVAKLRSAGLNTIFCMIADTSSPDQIRESMRSGARDYLLRPLHAEEMVNFLYRTGTSLLCEPIPEEGFPDSRLDPVLGIPYVRLSKLTKRILYIAQRDYRSVQTLTAIAEALDMSSKYIGRAFLRDTGMKFSEYLMSYRMLQARKQILSTQEKISVIAASVGYVQMNNFYIHFKNYFGVSPSAMRSAQALGEPTPGGKHEESV